MKNWFKNFVNSDVGLLILAVLITFFLWVYTGAEEVKKNQEQGGSVTVEQFCDITDTARV